MHRFYLILLIANLAASLFWFGSSLFLAIEAYLLLSLAHLALAGLVFFPCLLPRPIRLFDPLNLVIAFTLIGCVAPSYAMVFEPTPRIAFLMAGRPLSDFIDVGFLYVISTLLLGFGYVCCNRRVPLERVLPDESRLSGRGFQFAVYIGLAISGLAIAAYIQQTGGLVASLADISRKRTIEIVSNGEVVHATGAYLRMAGDVGLVLMLIALSYYLRNLNTVPTLLKVQLALLAMASLVIPFISSSRSAVIYVFFGLLIALDARGRLTPQVVASMFAIVLVAFGSMTALRSAAQGEARGAFKNPIVALAESGNGLSLPGTTHVVKGVPERMPFQLGMTYTTWLTSPIPRTIWPDKPDVSLGKRVKDEILGQTVIRTGRPASIIGEGWINFGLIGFLVSAFAFGYALRLISNSFYAVLPTSSFAVPLFFSFAVNGSALVNSAFSQGVVRILTDVVLVTLCYLAIQYSFARRGRGVPIGST